MTRSRAMQYNAMLGGQSTRPPRGASILGKPCCFTCIRLDLRDEGEADPHRDGMCPYLNREPEDALLWGVEQCAGFVPRPAEDYASQGAVIRSTDGAKIAAPGGKTRGRRKVVRTVSIIVPPSETALIVPPKPQARSEDRRDSGSAGGSSSDLPDDPGADVDPESACTHHGSVDGT